MVQREGNKGNKGNKGGEIVYLRRGPFFADGLGASSTARAGFSNAERKPGRLPIMAVAEGKKGNGMDERCGDGF